MSPRFALSHAPGGSLTTTCRTCGDSQTYPLHSVLVVWQRHHECPTATRESDAPDEVESGQYNGPEPVRKHQPGPRPTVALVNGRGAADGT